MHVLHMGKFFGDYFGRIAESKPRNDGKR